MQAFSSHMTMPQDMAFDKNHGIKENSKQDKKLDSKLGNLNVPKYNPKENNTKLAKRANLAHTFEKLAGKK